MQQSTYCIKLITEFQDSGSLKLKRLKEFIVSENKARKKETLHNKLEQRQK